MTIAADELQHLLDFAVAIAREAGEITLKYFRSQVAIENKADGSEVTAADREAEAHLRQRVSQQFPGDAIWGEEQENREGTSGRRWIVDPIDGTFSFVRGVPMFGVLVALADQAEVILGVVNLPATHEIVYAARGLGCFCNGEPARVSSTESIGEALLLSTDFGTAAR